MKNIDKPNLLKKIFTLLITSLFVTSCSNNNSSFSFYKVSYDDEETINKIFDESQFNKTLTKEEVENITSSRFYFASEDILNSLNTFKCYTEVGDINNETVYYEYNFEFDKKQNYMNEEEFYILHFSVDLLGMISHGYSVYYTINRTSNLFEASSYNLSLTKHYSVTTINDSEPIINWIEDESYIYQENGLYISQASFDEQFDAKINDNSSLLFEEFLKISSDYKVKNDTKDEFYYFSEEENKAIYNSDLLNEYYYGKGNKSLGNEFIKPSEIDIREMTSRKYDSNDIKLLDLNEKSSNLTFNVGNVMEDFDRDLFYEQN